MTILTAVECDAVRLEEVRKSFGALRAVDGLSARVARGTISGFLGPNGAGKTTTLRMLLDIIHPDSGTISLLGAAPGEATQARIGYLPEERGLYRKMSVQGVLGYLGRLKGMRGGELSRRISTWLERVGLAEAAKRRVEELSKGNQQKLQFAATVLHDPELVILDEPFSGLDPVNLELIRDILLSLRQEGKTIIFSTHVMDQAQKLCDSILLINSGRKILDGTLDEVLAGYRTNTVVLELDGETAFLHNLEMVGQLRRAGRRLEVDLRDGCGSQQLLAALAGRVHVRLFEEKVPSLHEIFVRLVGGNNA